MLGKLLKYDFKSMFRVFIPLWLALLALSLINSFTLNSNSMDIPGLVFMVAYIGVIVAVMAVTLVLIVQRFYNGLLKSEGYLMFTLPVHPWQLIASKAVAALVVTVLSTLAAVLSVLLIASTELIAFLRGLPEFFADLNGDAVLFLVLLILTILVEVLASIGHIYASMALGHLANSHRAAWSVGAYIAIDMMLSALAGVAVKVTDKLDISLDWQLDVLEGTNAILAILLFIALVKAALFFVTTERILSKKLNLE